MISSAWEEVREVSKIFMAVLYCVTVWSIVSLGGRLKDNLPGIFVLVCLLVLITFLLVRWLMLGEYDMFFEELISSFSFA